jgi:hypothetical protein
VWKLVDLADQVGQEVSLDGELWSLNGHWWFDYRGSGIYLISEAGPQLAFANDDHGRNATITGKLLYQLRPSLEQISLKSDRDLVNTYVVRGAKVTKGLYDHLGALHVTQHRVTDGVVELLAEESYRRNIMGDETKAILYVERNRGVIDSLVQNANEKVREVLTRRINDSKVDEVVRLLYATILSRVNDSRGREYLRKTWAAPGTIPKEELYYCLGAFPFLAIAEDEKVSADRGWVEKILIEIMSTPESAKLAARVSSIPQVLITINSPAARKVLLDYALISEGDPRGFLSKPSITFLLCNSSIVLPPEDLLRMEAITTDSGTRRIIMRAFLRQKHPAAVERFTADLEDSFVYMDIRNGSSPEFLATLKTHLPKLNGEAKLHAEMLLILGEKDPVPILIDRLKDPKSSDKSLVIFELARLADSRSVAPVAKLLREAPKDALKADSELTGNGSIINSLEVLARVGDREAFQALIELLEVDLSRLGGYTDKAGFQRIIAAHLIEISGESFGTDQAGWRAWEKAQPASKFRPAKKYDPFRTAPDQRIDFGR